MTPATVPTAPSRRAGLPARAVTAAIRASHLVDQSLGAPFDLLLRWWLAQAFLVSGLLKLGDWNTAVLLATYEYPVSWMSPLSAAITGVCVELIGGLLLAMGLATRPAALALAALTLVVQIEYQALNSHLYTMLLLIGLVIIGPRGLSLDQLLGRGVGDSALPGGRLLQHAYAALERYLAPLWRLLLRGVVAAVILMATGQLSATLLQASGYDPGPLRDFLAATTLVDPGDGGPLVTVAAHSSWLAGALTLGALLLAAGWVTRVAAFALLLVLTTLCLSGTPSALALSELMFLGAALFWLTVYGPGVWSVDALLRRVFERPRLLPALDTSLPHVVVVGAGFGGLAVVQALRNSPCRITLIDQHNYHLFQPLLYQIATAGLSPADIATPVREHLRTHDNVSVRMARVSGVDSAAREILLGDRRLAYDHLVLATGARHSYFGKDAWEPYAPGMKRIEDGIEVRRRLLLAFEMAENAVDESERAAWMNFVIVGAGPTGVELAGAIAELAQHGMSGEFRQIDPAQAKVILVQSGDRVLPSFSPALSAATLRSLSALGVDVRLGARVEAIDEGGVMVSGARIPARTVMWAAGVAASPAAEWLGAERDRAGRVKVAADLSVPGHADVYAIGDTAASEAWNGQPVPGLAPAAKQGGAYVAGLIDAKLRGRPLPKPFRYTHMGSLATIGRKSAVVEYGRFKLTGPLAWWFWGAIHVLFLASLRSRIAVAVEWMWAYLTFRRSTRLITGKLD
ncbi:MAG: FAD-dependent oxidoreductase [Lysobacterales bacterium]